MKKALGVLSFLFLILLAIPVVQAQDTLTQTYTAADGSFSLMYPADWIASEQSDGSALFASRTALNVATYNFVMQGAPPFEPGDAAVIFAPTTGVPYNLMDSATYIASAYGGTMDKGDLAVNPLTVGSFPAVRAVVAKAGSHYDVEVITLDFGSNQIGYIVGMTTPGELAALEPTLLAMLATATVGGSSSVTTAATVSPEATANPMASPEEAATAMSTEAPAAPTTTISLQPKMLWTDSSLSGFPVKSLAFGPDNASLFIGTTVSKPGSDDLSLVDTAAGKDLKSLSGLQRVASQVAFSPDGTTVAAIDAEALIVWDVASGTAKATIQKDGESPTDMAYNPKTGALLYITQADPEDTLWQLDLASGQPEALYTVTDRNNVLGGMAINPDGSSVLVGIMDYSIGADAHTTVYQVDLTSHNATKVFDQAEVDLIALLYPAQGQPLIVVNPSNTHTTQVWDITSDKPLYTLPEAKTKKGDTVATNLVAINPAGTILATGSISVEAQLWDAKTGAPIVTLDRNLKDMQNSEPYGFAFSSDGNWLAVVYGNGEIVLWSLDGSGAPATSGNTTSPTAAPTTAASTSPTATTVTAAGNCTVTAAKGANLRTGPGTTFARAGALAAGVSQSVIGQTNGSDGFVWWKLDSGSWVRSDLVQTSGDCTSVPTVAS